MHFSRAFRHAGRSTAALLISALAAGASFAAVAAKPATVGKPIALEGELDVLVEDYADGHSRTRHFLKTAHGRIELKLNRKAPNLHSGTRVRVRGEVQGDVLALDGTDTGSIESLAIVSPYTMGQQNVAVILVNFQDDTAQPKTVADANTLVLGTVGNHYKESSFGQTWFSGKTFGWYTIPMSDTVCDPYKLATLADQAVADAGDSLAGYNRKVYMFPKNACAWAGLGNVGGSSTKAWVNNAMTTLVVGHEIGHNLGLQHAQSLNCDATALGNTCTTTTYGDTADMMGNYRAGHFNPYEKELLGWLNDGVSPPILTASASGRYVVEPYSATTLGAKAIKIPRGVDSSGRKLWYYVEYRQPTGFDSVLASTGNMTTGVIVRTATEGDTTSSRQLDMSPGTSTGIYTELADGALAVGQSYTDATAKVTLTLAWTAATGAAVDVMLSGTAPAPTCTRAAPTLSLSGSTTAVSAGSTVNYTLSLSNKDSSACSATTFNLARSIPSGWTGTLGASTLSLSPGASGSTTLTVTSPASAIAGGYSIGAGASSSVGSAHTANASKTYSVATASSSGTLTGAVGTDKTSYLRGQTVYMSAVVKNNGVAVNGASVKFNVTLPGGVVTALTAVSGSDGYARTTYKLGKGKGAIGNYAVRAEAASGGSNITTASAYFSVN